MIYILILISNYVTYQSSVPLAQNGESELSVCKPYAKVSPGTCFPGKITSYENDAKFFVVYPAFPEECYRLCAENAECDVFGAKMGERTINNRLLYEDPAEADCFLFKYEDCPKALGSDSMNH